MADRIEHRGDIDFADGDGERFEVVQNRRTVVGYTNGHGVPAGPSASSGVQLNSPVARFMIAPPGAPASRLKVRSLAGRSASVAVAVKASSPPSSTLIADRIEYRSLVDFTYRDVDGFKVVQIRLTVVSDPNGHGVHSGTRRFIRRPTKFPRGRIDCRSGLCARVEAEGEVVGWRSGSVADAVNVSGLPSSTLCAPITANNGGRFTSFTVIVMVSKSSRLGTPSSVTRTVTVWSPGDVPPEGVQLNSPVLGSDRRPHRAESRD